MCNPLSDHELCMTLTLDFQGQILKKLYLMIDWPTAFNSFQLRKVTYDYPPNLVDTSLENVTLNLVTMDLIFN